MNGVVKKDLRRKAVTPLMVLFLDKGYFLLMDNYYISVGLFEELHERKILSCKVQQGSLPKGIFHLKARAVKQLKRGVSLYRKKA